ncbi:Ubiquinol-cytochrome C chaperone [Methyloligella halotolerans]|uniref:Ubiquinol-cytochrome C chaperone n=1 Tax=Methyloligella halotolerans TaxID=1177755 RepID=A0A1E2S2K1_9HYPH|nr:ubiquinol-cytochrome C chaperone family protein [Methyloligella halotolerans]ODA68568.1 Ubiquinol-cytochrome C chaperone [Methyloligella halotolerans]
MNPFNWLRQRSPNRLNAEKLYGAIVAQARLPVFYADFDMPDTLEGRLSVLTVHMFAVLRRLKAEGAEGLPLAQELVDAFSADMDTVLREMGVSDMKVPKRVRDICAKSHGVINLLEAAYPEGEEAFGAALVEILPLPPEQAKAASRRLTAYLHKVAEALAEQSLSALRQGNVQFPEVS